MTAASKRDKITEIHRQCMERWLEGTVSGAALKRRGGGRRSKRKGYDGEVKGCNALTLCGFQDAHRGDGTVGYDVIATRDGKTYHAECKFYAGNHGDGMIRRMLAGSDMVLQFRNNMDGLITMRIDTFRELVQTKPASAGKPGA